MLGFQNREQTTVNEPVETVFGVVSDFSRHADIAGSGEVQRLRQIGHEPLGVGAKFQADEEIRVLGRTRKMTASSEIVEFDAPTVVSWRSTPSVPPKPRRIQWWFKLSPAGEGTRVVHECEVDFGAVTNVLLRGPYTLVRGGAIRRGMRKTLENLRTQLSSS